MLCFLFLQDQEADSEENSRISRKEDSKEDSD